jgi:hypothetical protein
MLQRQRSSGMNGGGSVNRLRAVKIKKINVSSAFLKYCAAA